MLRRSVQVDQPAGERHGDRLGPVRYAQLSEDILEMDLDGLVGAPDSAGHLPVAQAPGHQLQDLELPLGELAALGKLGKPRRTARTAWTTSLSSMSFSR